MELASSEKLSAMLVQLITFCLQMQAGAVPHSLLSKRSPGDASDAGIADVDGEIGLDDEVVCCRLISAEEH